MNPDLKTEWVADLRANPDLQGTGAMRTANGKYCCLGRLCEVKGIPFDKEYEHYHIETDGDMHDFNDEFPIKILNILGIPPETEAYLICMNDDDRLTFLEIADWIEENL